jgi:uncharacterized Rossmann fold enzyme
MPTSITDPKFIHMRHHQVYHSIYGAQVIGSISPRGGVTIAYHQDGDNWTYAIAKCNTADNFVKATGRNKSAGRLRSVHHQHQFTGDRDAFVTHLAAKLGASPL